ncbi:MAG TPA: hypothetical protein VFO10_18095 [Oligoflexus sp.]|uniref:hypothetical protein n=1 Tax=Oligoflexus sp. TaxID=1971216 RepID=UPI002D80BFB0|nr:hypothetical protein [Oligoflexus sp.]HET9239177.1 hypothetical protein [Oligoflexus sp.]
METCARCGAIEFEGKDFMEVKMPLFSLRSEKARLWPEHILKVFALQAAGNEISASSMWLAVYLASHTCFHAPSGDGYIALKARRTFTEIKSLGMTEEGIKRALDELYALEFGKLGKDFYVCFSDEFLEQELPEYRADLKARWMQEMSE